MELLKKTKYLLVLLAGIMLVTGCGKCDGKGGAGGSVDPELEKKQEEILKELEPLYLEAEKESNTGNCGGASYDEATAKKKFKKAYTDPKDNSFVARFNFAKALFEKTAETGENLYALREKACLELDSCRARIKNNFAQAGHKKRNAFDEKTVELYKNLLAIIDKMMGVETEKK